jgi:hypothetical protein
MFRSKTSFMVVARVRFEPEGVFHELDAPLVDLPTLPNSNCGGNGRYRGDQLPVFSRTG